MPQRCDALSLFVISDLTNILENPHWDSCNQFINTILYIIYTKKSWKINFLEYGWHLQLDSNQRNHHVDATWRTIILFTLKE